MGVILHKFLRATKLPQRNETYNTLICLYILRYTSVYILKGIRICRYADTLYQFKRTSFYEIIKALRIYQFICLQYVEVLHTNIRYTFYILQARKAQEQLYRRRYIVRTFICHYMPLLFAALFSFFFGIPTHVRGTTDSISESQT